jgi:hypothetical protein
VIQKNNNKAVFKAVVARDDALIYSVRENG